MRGYRRIMYEDRKIIEQMVSQGKRVVEIAEALGCHRFTIYQELKRGGTPYNADVAQRTR